MSIFIKEYHIFGATNLKNQDVDAFKYPFTTKPIEISTFLICNLKKSVSGLP
jgi:hypothetical protein